MILGDHTGNGDKDNDHDDTNNSDNISRSNYWSGNADNDYMIIMTLW